MAEPGSRRPADDQTATQNLFRLEKEGTLSGDIGDYARGRAVTNMLREELAAKKFKGFKRGGKVKQTGKAKVHKGEYVIKASAAKKAGPKKLAAMNRAPAKMAAKKPAARRGR